MPTPTLEPPIAKAKCDMNWNDEVSSGPFEDEGAWLLVVGSHVGEDLD